MVGFSPERLAQLVDCCAHSSEVEMTAEQGDDG
jgi:hypothetical protein